MVFDPVNPLIPFDQAFSEVQDNPFLFIHGCLDFMPVQKKQCFQGCMAYPFVSIKEGVISHKGEAQSRSFFSQSWIKFLTAKCHEWLSQGGFQCTPIADAGFPTRLVQYQPVYLKHLSKVEVTHQARRR